MDSDKKKCPFCAEEVMQEALKCKHCGELFDNDKMGVDATLEKVGKKTFSFIGRVILYIFILMIIGVWFILKDVPFVQ